MRARAQSGFTLIELVVAMALLAAMMALVYSGLAYALRSWDAGENNARAVVDRRIGENFLRRELGEMFPMRWKDPMVLRFAFDGQRDSLRFVSARPPDVAMGGLSLVGLSVENGTAKGRRLVMRRAMPDDDAKDFGPLERAEPYVLIDNVDSVAFSYFGSENDFTEQRWTDTWTFQGHMPAMVRLTIRTADGQALEPLTVRVSLGEEAGCLESSFQRVCRPRRPNP
ncbi:MAG TPA: prepilin-type N-terminal cleavage/methylation domain-containing protein [Usitatibacter sp.]|nr:prepilin-type N-terminal cleavage/methylation domain-containing protein [Usitatibacter sp.]